MIQEETLRSTGRREYEDPDGEFLAFIDSGQNTVTVLTRTETREGRKDSSPVESPPIDPTELTVNEIKDALNDTDYQWNEAAYRGLLRAEEAGKDRTTATNAIEEQIDG